MRDVLEFLKDLIDEYLEEIIQFPGALICWIFKGFQTKFKNEWKHKRRNMIVGAIFWFLLITLIVLIVSKLL